jgi:hypothetical protein
MEDQHSRNVPFLSTFQTCFFFSNFELFCFLCDLKMKNTMICGIDTYHDSAKKKGSVCAFIATTNEDKTRFFSRATLQESHQELSSNLTLTVKCK